METQIFTSFIGSVIANLLSSLVKIFEFNISRHTSVTIRTETTVSLGHSKSALDSKHDDEKKQTP